MLGLTNDLFEIQNVKEQKMTKNDVEKVKYSQKVFDCALTGEGNRECLWIFHVPKTRSCKSTFIESAQHVLGCNVTEAMPDTLFQNKIAHYGHRSRNNNSGSDTFGDT